jgi:hypothetical protein
MPHGHQLETEPEPVVITALFRDEVQIGVVQNAPRHPSLPLEIGLAWLSRALVLKSRPFMSVSSLLVFD